MQEFVIKTATAISRARTVTAQASERSGGEMAETSDPTAAPGQYVGVTMHIQGLATGWWGEGDDMMFIDGDPMPTLNGTGLEDYFCGAWNFNLLNREYSFPYFGYSRKGNDHPDYTGRHSMYRFHIEDPIPFDKSLRVTIEHGHANNRGDDYSSVAYWYQAEPHKKFPQLPPVSERLRIDRWTAVPIK